MKKLLLTGFALVSMVLQAQTWTEYAANLPVNNSGLNNIQIVDANVAWGTGVNGADGSSLKIFSKTTNGGTTWTGGTINFGNAITGLSDITAVSANVAWVAGNGSSATTNGVWKTTDGGTTWTRQTIPFVASSFPDIVHFWDANNGVTMGDPVGGYFEIYTTNNGGTSWTRVPSANIPAPLAGEGGYTTIKDISVEDGTIWFGTNFGRVYKSSDKGISWTVAVTPIIDFGTAAANGEIILKNATTAWVIDQDNFISSTVDGGANWDFLSPVGNVYSHVAYVPGTTQTLISAGLDSADNRGSSVSTDGGLTWTDFAFVGQALDVAAFNSNNIISVGYATSVGGSGSAYKLSPLLGTVDASLSAKQVSVYPNPTSGEVNIVSKNNVKNVQLMDMNGKVIRNFSSVKQLNISSVESGVYLLKVTTEDGKSTATKLIKK